MIDNIDNNFNHINHILETSNSAIESMFTNNLHRLEMLKIDIDSYNPFNQLDKGYAIAKDDNGKWINSIEKVRLDDKVKILLKDGDLECLVLKKQSKN